MPKLSTELTLAEAADIAGLKPVTLRLQVERGKLRAKKMMGRWIVTPAELDRYLRDVSRKGKP